MFLCTFCSNTTISEQEINSLNIDLVNELNLIKQQLEKTNEKYDNLLRKYEEELIRHNNMKKDFEQYIDFSEHKYSNLLSKFNSLAYKNDTLKSFLTEGEKITYQKMLNKNVIETENFFNKYQKNHTETEELLNFRLNKIQTLEEEKKEQLRLINKLKKENQELQDKENIQTNSFLVRKFSNNSSKSNNLNLKQSKSNGSNRISNYDNLDINVNSNKENLILFRSNNNTPDLEILPIKRHQSNEQNFEDTFQIKQKKSNFLIEDEIFEQ